MQDQTDNAVYYSLVGLLKKQVLTINSSNIPLYTRGIWQNCFTNVVVRKNLSDDITPES